MRSRLNMVVVARPFLTQVSEAEFAITAVSFPYLIQMELPQLVFDCSSHLR